ncbi:hypothetical protein MXB_3251 [Myxobolus squamalis]|nr:hypothetical protein MXB_3251 [Myxobolus squamalis]
MKKKKAPSDIVIQATQLGLAFSLAKIAKELVRDILKEDFFRIDIYYFPTYVLIGYIIYRTGSSNNCTPPHGFNDFRFKDYAPGAFRYFRTCFGIETKDFSHSLCDEAMKELSQSGASGSLFYKSYDDVYVVKTVDEREAKFLQSLLVGYYMNLAQNKNTLLPKFFGLYLYSSRSQHFRFVVMNNLIPSYLKLDETYDIKGSTFKRRAKVKTNINSFPLFKDLDFLDRHRDFKGLLLDPQYYSLIISTIERDTRVLSSFKIMDYSLLIGIHNISAHVLQQKYNFRIQVVVHVRAYTAEAQDTIRAPKQKICRMN